MSDKNQNSLMERQLMLTDDGSATLYVPALDEHYHSVKGALAEAEHIYIEMGLMQAHRMHVERELRVLEIGLGTGLNAMLTLKRCEREGFKVAYNAVELYPLAWEEVAPLGYSDSPLFEALHRAPWDEEAPLSENFKLLKLHADVRQVVVAPVDVVYYDAFAPEKQPEMWTLELMERVYGMMNEGGVLTTYCAKGIVRRMLQQVGFKVERLAGPVGGKREILRATKI